LVVATVDHGLREGSAADAQRVVDEAHRLQVPCEVLTLALQPGPAVEARARAARYDALGTCAKALGLRFVATAHTASDQAETVLMRLTRGSALAGAGAIHEKRRDGVVRPLLFATRADTQRYVDERAVAVVDDPMNEDPAFLRVRVRTEVMPLLERVVGPHAVAALSRFASYAAEDEAFLAEAAALALERARLGPQLDWLAVVSTPQALRRRLLALWLAEQGVPIDALHLDDALRALLERRSATLPLVSRAPARLHGTSSSDDGRPLA